MDVKSARPLSLCRAATVLAYLQHLDEVEGWFSATTALGMTEILWHQEERGVAGNLAEIGIHHGKSFLTLAGAARSSETVFAIDVFERQELNLDHSGCGNRAMFEGNLKRIFPGAKVSIITESSADVRGREAEFGLAGLRFLSIDGGHTREFTLNDLRIADASLVEGGACCLDDVFNAHWPGVVSGLFDFLEENNRLVPFACFPNKLFLCRPAWKECFLAHMRSQFGYALERSSVVLRDAVIDVIGERWPSMSGTFEGLARVIAGERVAAAEARAEKADTQAAAAEARTEKAEKRAEEAETRAERADRMLAAMQESRSWRVTAPLRAVGGVVRGRGDV